METCESLMNEATRIDSSHAGAQDLLQVATKLGERKTQ